MKIYYSGLIVESDIHIFPFVDSLVTKNDIDINFNKIKNLPRKIREKILEVPQYKIFFIDDVPFYVTQKDNYIRELPCSKDYYSGCYYDPVIDTEAYKMVIKRVRRIANRKYKKELRKKYGKYDRMLGNGFLYRSIESDVLYDKYGLHCVNEPMNFNPNLRVD